MDKISAVVITYNAAATIGECVDALKKVSDEIIIIDSFSTDNTAEICRQKDIIFIQQHWPGYGPQKNSGISKALYDYILSVDADEIIDAELAASILAEKKTGLNNHYAFRRLNFYYTQFVRHGAEKPGPIIRLFNKNSAYWDDKPVHETLVVKDDMKTKILNGFLLHYSYDSISHHIEKANTYTSLSAEGLMAKGKKNYLFKMVFSPPVNFFINFFIRGGFRDGMSGLILATFSAHATFIKYAKLWEMYRKKNDNSSPGKK